VEHKLCVLIDFENVAAGTEKEGLGRFDIRLVFRRLKDKGRILVSRSYGDWGRFAKYKQRLLEQGVTMVELTSYRGAEKNRADIALVVDAMELAFTREHIDTFVLLSGDSDFTPLVMRLKELDRRVIGIGTRGSTSRLLVESCDEFIFYDTLARAEQARLADEEDDDEEQEVESASGERSVQTAPTLSREEVMSLLVETLSGIQKDEPGPVLGGLVKQSMLRKAPAFDETEYGYAGFARLLESARDKGLVRLIRDERAGGYRVDLPEMALPPAPPPAPALDEDDDDTAEVPPALGPEASRFAQLLAARGAPVVSHMARHTVVHELVDHVTDRERKKKRNTLQYVYGDIARRCRKTDPPVDAGTVRAVINVLKAAGELKHPTGGAVRSANAHFVITRDADDLLVALRRYYVSILMQAGERIADGAALSQLLWNDDEHKIDAEEILAWLLRQPEEVPRARDESPAPADERAAARAGGEE
jgi:uncharacterized protein (TIGR00288 family)